MGCSEKVSGFPKNLEKTLYENVSHKNGSKKADVFVLARIITKIRYIYSVIASKL